MMGRTHALTGAMAFGLAAIPTTAIVDLHPRELLLGTAVTAGAAVLPDIDHPGAGISRTFGPITRGFAWLVSRASGGHRRGTHSLAGVAVFALIVFTATALYARNVAWLAAGVGLAIALTAAGALTAAAGPPARGRARPAYRIRWHGTATAWLGAATVAALTITAALHPHATGLAILGALLILVLSATARIVNTRRLLGLRREWDDLLPIPVTLVLLAAGADLRVVPIAVVLGVVVHIAGDMITLGGCPLGWPWSQTMRGPRWFRTGAEVEMGPITWACSAVFVAAVGWHTGVLAMLLGLAAGA